MNLHAKTALLLIGVLSLSPVVAMAADDGLYDKPIDPNSSFVRVLSPGANLAVIDGKTLDTLTDGLSPYVNVQPGDISVVAGEATGTVPAASGTYYTLSWSADGKPVVLQDAAPSDPSKAEVYVYNFSDKPTVDLFVPAAKADALKAVPMNGGKAVALKAPLTIDVELHAGDDTLASIKALDLKRRGGMTIILTGTGAAYTATATENSFFREQ